MSKVTSPLNRVFPGLPLLESQEKISLGFSQREDGGMSFNRLPVSECTRNRERFFQSLNLALTQTVWAELVHGNHVETVTATDAGRGAYSPQTAIPATDGLWTMAKHLVLCTTHADCIPLYFFAPEVHAVGVAHCGWRSIVAGLPENMIAAAHKELGVSLESIRIGIGPGIRTDCFEVSEEILDSFPPTAIIHRDGKWYVDLIATIQTKLAYIGIKPQQIEDSGICSRCTPVYSSYRRDRIAVEPAVAFIQLND
ncbi:MAG: polyphenol oxidase family protein [bacterium]|nr:polyphenol oxidase family protein [bacterium]